MKRKEIYFQVDYVQFLISSFFKFFNLDFYFSFLIIKKFSQIVSFFNFFSIISGRNILDCILRVRLAYVHMCECVYSLLSMAHLFYIFLININKYSFISQSLSLSLSFD